MLDEAKTKKSYLLIKDPETIMLDYVESNKVAGIFRAINHPLRKQILEFIAKNDKINVTKIYHKLKIEQSVASHHLSILRNAGMIKADRVGKFIHYSINKKRVAQIAKVMEELLNPKNYE